MSQPKVSIIVPVYNVEKYLERCMSSLVNQSLKDIEIILVNDGSKDASAQICDKYAQEDIRVKIIHKINEGAGIARNTALKIATGKYIGFVDSDDFIENNMFEILYDKAEYYNSDLVMSGVIFVDGNMFSKQGEYIRKTYFEKDTLFETDDEIKTLRMGIIGSLPDDAEDSKYGMSVWKNLFRSEIIKENNLCFQSERKIFSEDAMFMIDYISCINKAVGIPEAFYNYCRNGESLSKAYRNDRFDKSLAFITEVKKNFEKDIPLDKYSIYIDRFWQAFCRVICSQEIMHAIDNKSSNIDLKKKLKVICSHSMTESTLSSYPIATLPLKQRLFAYAMKYKLYFVLKLLVKLRNR